MTPTVPRRGRPPVSTREALEEVAFTLLLRDGYEATTIRAIMSAGGVGRTTFFRYFGSKGGIVWGEFDRAVERLHAQLEDCGGEVSVMTAVIDAVSASTVASRDAAPETWLDRFRVLDEDPALTGETAEHWRIWAAEIAGYVQRRTGLADGDVVAAAIGGAVQAAYVAVLRQWASDDAAAELSQLRIDLTPIATALQALLDAGVR